MFKDRYNGANAYVDMTKEIDSSMLASLGQRRRRRFLLIFAALLSVVILAPMALNCPPIYAWLREAAPPIARLLSPALGGAEQNGIRMEIASAASEGNTLELEVTFEDLEGDRLSAAARPCNATIEELTNYSGAFSGCTYDEQTGKLHCRFRYTSSLDREQFASLAWGRFTVEYLDLDISTGMTAVELPIVLTETDASGDAMTEAVEDTVAVIQDGDTITCMTILNGQLHIQVRSELRSVTHAYNLVLTGPSGERITMSGNYKLQSDGAEYKHWVFDLRGRDIAQCSLTAWLDSAGRIYGPWSASMSVETAG